MEQAIPAFSLDENQMQVTELARAAVCGPISQWTRGYLRRTLRAGWKKWTRLDSLHMLSCDVDDGSLVVAGELKFPDASYMMRIFPETLEVRWTMKLWLSNIDLLQLDGQVHFSPDYEGYTFDNNELHTVDPYVQGVRWDPELRELIRFGTAVPEPG